jgi:hypothetical protein
MQCRWKRRPNSLQGPSRKWSQTPTFHVVMYPGGCPFLEGSPGARKKLRFYSLSKKNHNFGTRSLDPVIPDFEESSQGWPSLKLPPDACLSLWRATDFVEIVFANSSRTRLTSLPRSSRTREFANSWEAEASLANYVRERVFLDISGELTSSRRTFANTFGEHRGLGLPSSRTCFVKLGALDFPILRKSVYSGAQPGPKTSP